MRVFLRGGENRVFQLREWPTQVFQLGECSRVPQSALHNPHAKERHIHQYFMTKSLYNISHYILYLLLGGGKRNSILIGQIAFPAYEAAKKGSFLSKITHTLF